MESRIKQVMASALKVDISEISDNSSADSIETWDSLCHMNLILALEEEFKLEFEIDEISTMVSYKLIRIIINDKVNLKR